MPPFESQPSAEKINKENVNKIVELTREELIKHYDIGDLDSDGNLWRAVHRYYQEKDEDLKSSLLDFIVEEKSKSSHPIEGFRDMLIRGTFKAQAKTFSFKAKKDASDEQVPEMTFKKAA